MNRSWVEQGLKRQLDQKINSENFVITLKEKKVV